LHICLRARNAPAARREPAFAPREEAKAMQGQTTPQSVSAVLGRHVFSADGAYAGDIVEMLLDVDGGRIRFAVVVPGGPFGVEGRWVCLPFQALRYDVVHDCFVLRQGRAMVNAPTVDDDVRELVMRAQSSSGNAMSSAISLRCAAANAE
jgi:sporulation protein YlmC with PRC-barrel domain